MRFFAVMHVPRCHVNTTLSNTIFSREYQLFACWLKMLFWIRVEKFMLSVHLVLEICGLKTVGSFNFALSAPHVKRRVKSCESSAAAVTIAPFPALYETRFVVKYVLLVCLFLQFSAGKIARALQRECSFSTETSNELTDQQDMSCFNHASAFYTSNNIKKNMY